MLHKGGQEHKGVEPGGGKSGGCRISHMGRVSIVGCIGRGRRLPSWPYQPGGRGVSDIGVTCGEVARAMLEALAEEASSLGRHQPGEGVGRYDS